MTTHSVERVIVVPRNGYVNRLQAWASAAIMAGDLGVPCQVAWQPQPAGPAEAEVLFAGETLDHSFVRMDNVTAALGTSHEDLPRYLTVLPDRHVVALAGHDRGEQVFMPQLHAALQHASGPTTLVIIAGGAFCLPGTRAFADRRRDFYRSIAWSPPIDEQVSAALLGRGRYLGAHIRQTDRSRQAPTPRAIRAGLARLRDRTGITSLFIAADNEAALARWADEAGRLGLRAWTAEHADIDRATDTGAVAAMTDWRLLGGSEALVYTRESSFGAEATVAAGAVDGSEALAAGPVTRTGRALLHGASSIHRRATARRREASRPV
ncbi:MAG: hypothetical protein Q8M17_11015 [Actinomycetota bacterium]|nr:hypothetical protein [Actinomycetota bacterium]